MDLIFLSCLLLMTVSIIILLKLLEKLFAYTLGKIFQLNSLGYAHWFMLMRISQMKDHYISMDQDRYTTSVVPIYLDTSTVKSSTIFNQTIFPSDMIFTKEDVSTCDDQVDNLTSEFNVHYRSYIGSFIYLSPTRVDLSFLVHKLEKLLENPGKIQPEGLVHLLGLIRDNKNLGLEYYAYS